jgi:GT2 family glycosyltransferase
MTQTTDSFSDLTAIIKTFERPACLDRLIRSIRRFYPRLHVIVADDGFQPSPRGDVEYLRLPPDVGLSVGRNALLAQVRTPYFLLLDDDLKFTDETQIEQLLAVARKTPGTIAGGTYLRCKRKFGLWVQRRPQPYHGTLERTGDQLALRAGWHSQQDDHSHCDLVHNFFVARADDIRQLGGWNPRLKLNDHVEFFVRVKGAGLRVSYCPNVVVEHWNTDSPRSYSQYRNRNFLALSFALHGIRTFITRDGKSLTIPPLESFTNSVETVSEHDNEQSSTRDLHFA